MHRLLKCISFGSIYSYHKPEVWYLLHHLLFLQMCFVHSYEMFQTALSKSLSNFFSQNDALHSLEYFRLTIFLWSFYYYKRYRFYLKTGELLWFMVCDISLSHWWHCMVKPLYANHRFGEASPRSLVSCMVKSDNLGPLDKWFTVSIPTLIHGEK